MKNKKNNHFGVFKTYRKGVGSFYALAKEYKEYKGLEFKVMRDNKKFRSFEEAKAHVKEMKISSQKEWNRYWTSGQKPEDIPHNPEIVYAEEWKGWNDFLANPKSRIEEMAEKLWDFSELRRLMEEHYKSPPKK